MKAALKKNAELERLEREETEIRRKQKYYEDACNRQEKASTVEDYQKLCRLFNALGNYKDSVQRYTQCCEEHNILLEAEKIYKYKYPKANRLPDFEKELRQLTLAYKKHQLKPAKMSTRKLIAHGKE